MPNRTHAGFRRLRCLFVCLLFLVSTMLYSLPARADIVTDNLSVCVGYFGMELDEYVTVGTYHWSELEQNVPITSAVYSYYAGGTFNDEYTAVVDTANGFLLKDLLDYAHIYYNDVSSLLFYVEDAQGIWVSFDRDTLFADRYYFDNLPAHRRILYATTTQQVQIGEEPIYEAQEVTDEETGETTTQQVIVGYNPIYEEQEVPDYTHILGYDFEDAWNAAEPVEPMLALEDNWAAFNETFEDIGPDDSYLSTGNRFRLLFGQQFPTESLTHDSAKYVSRIYVTLNGAPQIGEMPEEIDNTIGSHEFTMTVDDVYNEDMVAAISSYLNLTSTDESILVIDNIEFNTTAYSDQVSITVSYSILQEGEAGFNMTIGGETLTNTDGQGLSDLTTVTTVTPEPSEEPSPSPEPSEEPEPEPSPSPSPPVVIPEPSGVPSPSPGPADPDTPVDPSPAPSAPVNPVPVISPSPSGAPDTPAVPVPSPTTPAAGTASRDTTGGSTMPAPTPTATAAPVPTPTPAPTPSPSVTPEPESVPEKTPPPEDRDELVSDVPAVALPEAEELVQTLPADSAPTGFSLAEDAGALLDGSRAQAAPAAVVPEEPLDRVLVEDNSAEKEREQRLLLLLTCLGLALITLLGAGTELLVFRRSLGAGRPRAKTALPSPEHNNHPDNNNTK